MTVSPGEKKGGKVDGGGVVAVVHRRRGRGNMGV